MKLTIKHILITVIIPVLFIISSCSTDIEKKSEEYCKCLEKNKDLTIPQRIEQCENLLSEIYGWNDTDEIIREKNSKFIFFLDLHCNEYKTLKNEVLKSQDDWIVLKQDIEPEIDTDACHEFNQFNEFYYETDGDTTHLIINDGIWEDSFQNGRYYSKLIFKWINDCEFEIEFIESTEPNRMQLFKTGDIFNYKIIDKSENYFLVRVQYEDVKQLFKLYIKK